MLSFVSKWLEMGNSYSNWHGTVIGLEEMVLSNDDQFSSCRMLCLVLVGIC